MGKLQEIIVTIQERWAATRPNGHCFPKDLSAIIEITKEKNITNNVLKAAQTTNNTVRSNRDWEKMKGRAIV